MSDVTQAHYELLAKAYKWFNAGLFTGNLPDCLITLQREVGAGYFWQDKFMLRRGKTAAAEIAINPDSFSGRTDREILSTLVHEMVHLWQCAYGHPGRARYHNIEWAEKMEELGLAPSHTGRPGGRKTGDRMSHYIVRKGPYAISFRELYQQGFRFRWESQRAPSDPRRNKCRFSCPSCQLNVWGASNITGRIACIECDRILIRSG